MTGAARSPLFLRRQRLHRCLTVLCVLTAGMVNAPIARGQSLAETVQTIQPKVVKIYGAGGIRGLEAYQSGFLISADGHILTAFSYVLDTDEIGVTLHDGREFVSQLVGSDPRLELAVLKIDAVDLPHFVLSDSATLSPGDRILAVSNLYGIATGNEPASVLHGVVAARSRMAGRRGAYDTPYQGPIYILDAVTNNAGAAGGALTDRRGRLAGVLGKELRSSETNLWLNYALPIAAIQESVTALIAGTARPRQVEQQPDELAQHPWTLPKIGMVLVPNLLPKTPPFVESVVPGSPAELAEIRPDDLIMYVGPTMVRSLKELHDALQKVEHEDDLQVTLLRGRELISLVINH